MASKLHHSNRGGFEGVAQVHGVAVQCGFGRAVERGERLWEEGPAGRDVDQHAGTPVGHQVRDEQLPEVDRRGEQGVDLVLGFGPRGTDPRRCRPVAGYRRCDGLDAGQAVNRRGEPAGAAAGDHHAVSGGEMALGESEADTRAAAGDEHCMLHAGCQVNIMDQVMFTWQLGGKVAP
jgi:hypothetical protein